MNKKLVFGIAATLAFALVSTVYTANLQHGDPSLEVNGSPVLTAATHGGLSGEIISATAEIPGAMTQAIYTTPATGIFVLKEICVLRMSPVRQVLFGSTQGAYARTSSDLTETGSCTTYLNGIRIPASETLSFYNNAASLTAIVTISGIYQAP